MYLAIERFGDRVNKLRFFKTDSPTKEPFIGFVNSQIRGWVRSENGHMKPFQFYLDMVGTGSDGWKVRRITKDEFNHWMLMVNL